MATESSPTILIVEDDRFLSSMYAEKFGLEGYQVTVAGDGLAGLEAAARQRFSLVLLDILLPKVDGLEVLHRLRARPEYATTPIVMLTNVDQSDDIDRAKAEGATDYLVKAQFIPSEVVAKVRQYLQ